MESRLGQAATGGVIGGVAGGILGKTVEAATPYVSRAWNAVKGTLGVKAAGAIEDEVAKAAADTGELLDNPGALQALDNAEPPASPILGRAGGAADEPIIANPHPNPTVVEEVPLHPVDGEEAIGSISRTGLTELQAEVEKFRNGVLSEGNRAVDVVAGDPAKATVGEFRLGNLGDGPDTMSLLGALVRQLPSVGARTDAELMTTAQKAVASIGEEDPAAFLEYAKQAAGKIGDVDTTMAVLRTIWRKAADQIDLFHGAGIDWASASDDLVREAGVSIRNLSLLSHQVQTVKAALGRGLRVNALPDSASYMEALATGVGPRAGPREMPTLPVTREDLDNWMGVWGMTKGNSKLQAKFLQGTLTVPSGAKYLRTSFANFFTASILSAPRTVLLNVAGPAVISVTRNIERASGAALNSFNPWLSAEERAAQRYLARNSATAYLQTFSEVRDSFRQALNAAEQNHTLIGGGGQTIDVVGTYGPFNENLLKAAGADPNWTYSLGNAINFFPKEFARLNNGLDEFSKRLAYQGEVRINAMVEGFQKGLTGDEHAAFVAHKMETAYDEAGAATDEMLLRSAERTTLTSQPGTEGGWVRRFSGGLQQMRRDIPEVRYIIPVFNVPANALGETIRRLPIAFVPKVGRSWLPDAAAELAGERGVVAQADAYGRHMLGAGFLMAGYQLTQAGLITGAGPRDPTDRKVWLQTHQPYSIRIGDTWVRYDKFDILGGILSIPATLSDLSVYHKTDDSFGDHMMAGVASLAQWFKDRAALRNAVGILELGDNPTQDPGSVLQRMAANVATGFYPAALRTTLTDTTDPYNRMKRDWGDYIKSVLPGFSNQLEPMRNVLGEPIHRNADTLGEAFFPATLTAVASWKNEPVLDELDRLYQATGYGAGADPRSLLYGHDDPRDVKLEDGRSLYDHAMQGRLTLKMEGKTLKETLNTLFHSSEYQNGVDGSTNSRLTSRGDVSRAFLTAQVFNSFNEAAKADIARTSPKGRAYMTAASAKNRDSAYLRDLSVEQLATNPDLYRARGVDPGPYSDKLDTTGGGSDALLQALSQ
jgi:hypothetical protein